MKKEHITTQENLENWLTKNNIDEKTLSLKLYKYLQFEKFKESKFGPQVESIFLSNKDNLDKVMYSIFRSKDKAKAVEIHLKIDEQESTFADLASEFSEGIENQINGLIGPIEIGKINLEIAERLKISKRGQLWEPFQVDDWWVLLRLEKYLPCKLDTSTKKRIINDLYTSWIDKEVNVAINNFKLNSESIPEKSPETLNSSSNISSNEDQIKNRTRMLPDSSRLESSLRSYPLDVPEISRYTTKELKNLQYFFDFDDVFLEALALC